MKARLIGIAPVFIYLKQYVKGKDNTSYKVPAIYIELPDGTPISFYGRKLMTAMGAQFKVHYISYAPFKNHENPVQDSAIAAHETKVREIDTLINGWNAADQDGKIITQQLLPVNASLNNFMSDTLVSIITYQTEVYSRHLQV